MGRLETGERLNEQVNEHIQDLQSQLAEGHSESYLASLQWYSSFHKYSWANAWLIVSQCPQASLVAGYKTWQQLGFQVRKGEKGITIRAPWIRKEVDPQTGEVAERLVGYLATSVFDISQTAEYPDKQPPSFFQEVPGDFQSLYEHLVERVKSRGLEFEEQELQQDFQGYYRNGKVVINSNLSPYLKVTTIIHEVVHSLVHSTKDEAKQWSRDEREWQAESVCYTVCRAIGIENVNSRDYLLSYRLTTDRLSEMMKFIQGLTKQVLQELDLLQPVKTTREAMAGVPRNAWPAKPSRSAAD